MPLSLTLALTLALSLALTLALTLTLALVLALALALALALTLDLNKPRHRLRLAPTTRRAHDPSIFQSHLDDLVTYSGPKPHLPSRLGLWQRPYPLDGIRSLLAQPPPQQDLRRLGWTVLPTTAAKQIQRTDLSGSASGHEGIHMLGPQAAVHQPIGEPQSARCEPVSAQVTRLPHIDALGLNRAEHPAAMQPAAPVAASVHTNQTHRLGGLGRERIEVDIEEVFVALPSSSFDTCCRSRRRGHHHELGSLPRSDPGAG